MSVEIGKSSRNRKMSTTETNTKPNKKEINLLEIRFFDPETGISHSYSNYNSITEDGKKYHVDTLIWPQVIAAVAAGFCHLAIAVIGGFTGVSLPALTNPDSNDIYLDIKEASIFSSIPVVAFIVGSFITGFIMNWFGQRVALIIALPFGILGWLILYFTSNVKMMIASRFIMGLAGGGCTSACNIYVVEIAHTSIRGRLIAIIDLMRQIGFVFVAVIGSINLHWRYVGLVCGLFSCIPPLVILFFLPNSPRWLATKARKDEANKALRFFRGSQYDVDKEMEDILSQLENSMKDSGILNQLKLLKNRTICERFVILSIMMFLVHFVGNIISAMYTISIYQAANTGIDEYMSTVVSVSMRIFGAVTYIIIADKFNRKCLLILPLSVTALSLVSLGTYFYVILNYDVQYLWWLPLTSMSIYLYSTSIYYSALMLFGSELLPTSIRTFGGSVHFLLLNVGMFVVVYIYPYMIESVGLHWTFWFYAFNAVIIIILALIFLPETKGKSLEQIGDVK